MSEEFRGRIGVVIRRDGTVPFDDDVHPVVRLATIQHLTDEGHILENQDDGSLKIVDYVPPE